MKKVALVGCGKSKREDSNLYDAADLYTGDLFQKSLAYAKTLAPDVYILSAKYDLLELQHMVRTYDVTLADFTCEQRLAWGIAVVLELGARHGDQELELVVLAGSAYVAPLISAITIFELPWTVTAPMARMQIGERLSFLKAKLQANRNTEAQAVDQARAKVAAANLLEAQGIANPAAAIDADRAKVTVRDCRTGGFNVEITDKRGNGRTVHLHDMSKPSFKDRRHMAWMAVQGWLVDEAREQGATLWERVEKWAANTVVPAPAPTLERAAIQQAFALEGAQQELF